MIGGAQCFQVELHAGVGDTGRGVGKGFEFGVVGGDQGRNAALEKMREQGPGQGCPLLGVGSSPQFVKDDQATMIGLFQDADDVGDVPRKCG